MKTQLLASRAARGLILLIVLAMWTVHSEPALSAPDTKEREHAISMYAKWIDIAHEMGARSVRCDPGIINLADKETRTIGANYDNGGRTYFVGMTARF